jgi:hypothetical protein
MESLCSVFELNSVHLSLDVVLASRRVRVAKEGTKGIESAVSRPSRSSHQID